MENTETNKKLAQQALKIHESGDYDQLAKITDTKKFKLHFPGVPQALNYDDGVKLNKEYTTAFPDVKITIDGQVAEGDKVVTMLTYSGTQTGVFQGMPASNKKVKVSGVAIQKFENGKIVEEWDEFDAVGMMQQMGAFPESH